MTMKPAPLLLLLLLFVCLSCVYALIPPRKLFLNNLSKGILLTMDKQDQDQLWFNQTLDHFSPYDQRKFQQRYYEFLDYFRNPNGPIFIVICGEEKCDGIAYDYTAVLAKKFGAAMVSLEHRYYGLSTPFDNLSTENLKYLSTKQTLFDLAVFRQYYQDSLNAKLNKTEVENPWFFFGGSYAGALSAWFRLKFPHLICGSLASSAVVHAIQNFTEFDQQVGESAGPDCKAVLQEITELIDTKLATNGTTIREKFNATSLVVDGDFLSYLADAAVQAIQYGNPDVLCKPLVDAKRAGADLVEAYAKYVKETYNDEIYDREHLKKPATNEDRTSRLWLFQLCTELGFFQVAPSNDSVRSSKIDSKYYLDLCKDLFGDGIFPDVDATNLYYGGTKIAGSKIIFTNGSQDPCRRASKQTSSPDMPSYLITCRNCAHCIDLVGCDPQDTLIHEGHHKNCSSAVQKVRQKIQEHMDLWLSECTSTHEDAS